MPGRHGRRGLSFRVVGLYRCGGIRRELCELLRSQGKARAKQQSAGVSSGEAAPICRHQAARRSVYLSS